MNIVLSPYPLSSEYVQKLAKLTGTKVNEITITKLRSMPVPAMLRYLRSLAGDKVLIPLEDKNSVSILPIMAMLALITRAKTIWMVDPDLNRKKITIGFIFTGMCRFLVTSGFNFITALSAYMTAGRLLKKKAVAPCPPAHNHITYLKTNLWFGIKAGGSVGHIAGVVNGFIKKKARVDFYGVEVPPMVNGAAFKQLPVPSGFGIPSELNMYAFDNAATLYCSSQMKGRDLGFIYQRMSVGNITGVKLSRKFKLPLVIEYNGSEVWIQRNWGNPLKFEALAQRCEDVCLKHAHLIVTISQPLKDELINKGVAENKIVFYPNCIDPDIFDPGRFSDRDTRAVKREWRIPEDSLVATFLGTFGQWHGVDILAQAITGLVDRHETWLKETKLHFLIVGDGLNMPLVKKTLSHEKYKPYFTLTGLVEQSTAPRYLAASDILLSPHVPNPDGTPFFGSPTKLFEYMAMGKAIVASDLDQIGDVLKNSIRTGTCGTPEQIRADKRVAVLVEPGSAEDLIKGIRLVAKEDEIRSILGQYARQEALEKYTWVCHVEAILDKIIDGGR